MNKGRYSKDGPSGSIMTTALSFVVDGAACEE